MHGASWQTAPRGVCPALSRFWCWPLELHAGCQVFILDALAGFQAESPKDAEAIIERVTPRLQHANSAVVLSTVKVLCIRVI